MTINEDLKIDVYQNLINNKESSEKEAVKKSAKNQTQAVPAGRYAIRKTEAMSLRLFLFHDMQ